MGKLKESAISELHWVLPGWNEGHDAYVKLRQLIRDDASFFAEAHVSARTYGWNHPAAGWMPLSAAPADVAANVEDVLANISERIHSTAPAYAGAIMSFPNDDYVFYRTDENGALQVIITGWGYSNYKKATGRVFRKARRTKTALTDVRIAFTSDGIPVPSRQFDLIDKGGNLKRLSTGPDGWFAIPGQPVGASETFVDAATGKRFTAVWTEGQQDYTFDVTRKATLAVSVKSNGAPCDKYPVSVESGSAHYNVPLSGGFGSLTLTAPEGEPAKVSCNGEYREITLEPLPAQNSVDFDFTELPEPPGPPVPPVPPVEKIEISVVDKDGKPMAHAGVALRQNGNVLNRTLDENGRCSLERGVLLDGVPVSTDVVCGSRTFNNIVWTPQADENSYVLQQTEEKSTPVWLQVLAVFGMTLAAVFFAWGIVEFGKYINHLFY
ncbi:MAG: hypothetical protein NC328_02045 [Muribaculum sp.]|nr:hypothetical protein [Muribaculum sp.]